MVNKKQCSMCRVEKPTEQFYKCATSKDGFYAYCIDCRRIYRKEYREKNREKHNKYNKDWCEKNREITRIRNRLQGKKRREMESHKQYMHKRNQIPKNKINRAIGCQMNKAIARGKRGYRWEDIVGYTLTDLLKHLKSLFKEGMTWDNYGLYGWHIDHIRPLSSFKFKDVNDPQVAEAWALSNLQPLWAKDNLRKGASMEIKEG